MLILIILLIATSYLLYIENKGSIQNNDSDISYLPATKNEKNDVEDKKTELSNDAKNKIVDDSKKPPSTVTTVPTITSASSKSVSAYVSGIFEEGGTCIAEFSKDNIKLSKESIGFQNVSYTQCAPISLENGFLDTGKWVLVLKYKSDKSEGISLPQIIEVP